MRALYGASIWFLEGGIYKFHMEYIKVVYAGSVKGSFKIFLKRIPFVDL